MDPARLLVLGSGYAGSRALRLGRERGLTVVGTVRSEASAQSLRAMGFQVLVSAQLDEGSVREHVDQRTQVVVAFPPDGHSDARLAPLLAAAHSVVYISSTGVYGEQRGHIDDATPLPSRLDDRARRILQGEDCYRDIGATVLRCPGIYGPERGLHVRVLRGEHRIPGDGSRSLSRIHVDDLAQLLLSAAGRHAETFVVGDLEPARHIDVVRWICDTYRIDLPPMAPLESVHASLRADRQVDSSRALSQLGVSLRYPSYRDGMAPAATGIAPRLGP